MNSWSCLADFSRTAPVSNCLADFSRTAPVSNSRNCARQASHSDCPVFEICASKRSQLECAPPHILSENRNSSSYRNVAFFLQNTRWRKKSSRATFELWVRLRSARSQITVNSRSSHGQGKYFFPPLKCICSHQHSDSHLGAIKWALVVFERIFDAKIMQIFSL
jgi:hypothetical protein